MKSSALLITVVLVVISTGLCASEQQGSHTQKDVELAVQESTTEEQTDENGSEAKRQSPVLDYIERDRERAENIGNRAVQWVDSFFSDPAYEAEVATSQARVRPEAYYRSEQGWKPKIKFSFKFRLPNLERHVSLFGGSTDGDSSFDQAVDEDVNEPVIGVQFLGKERGKWNTSLSVGLKFNEFAGFLGPRFRYRTDLSERTSFRFVQKILWQTNNHWQSRSRFDFNFAVNERFFFRQMVDGRWRGEYSDEEGFRTRVSSFLTARLGKTSGLQSEATAVFHTRPDTHVDEYVVALRYRKQTWREWFYYEIVPQLSWEDEFDYKLNPGIRLRIEIFYGSSKASHFWKREAEDTHEFRW